jgi:HD-GYP domain-containing protein (c-di-GMP phosphodiesterase class II)
MPAFTKARAYVAATTAAGAVVVVVALTAVANASLTPLMLLVAGSIAAELLQVPSDDTSFDAADAHTVGFSSGLHLAAIILIGARPAVLVAVAGVLVVDRLRAARLKFVAFNSAVYGLATLAAGTVYAVTHTAAHLQLPRDFVPVLLAIVTYFAVNTGLVSIVIGLESGRSPAELFLAATRHEFLTKAAEAGIAVAVAALAIAQPWALVALLPLGIAVYHAYARLAQMRRETGRALETFANVVDERDSYTYRHSERVAEYVVSLARALRLPDRATTRLRWAGRLHDLGKVAVDPAVLNKPGALRDTEWASVVRHPRLSARLLRRFRLAAEEARAVEYHHERYDGSGYYHIDPGDIPLAAHFLIVADSFDAMTTDRPYRAGLTRETALEEIERNAGKQFHPLIARAFVAHQRGEDVASALREDELRELRRVMGKTPLHLGTRLDAVPLPEAAVVAGAIAAAVCVSFGATVAAIVSGALALAGLAGRHVRARRCRRLARGIRTLAKAHRSDLVFHALCGRLSGEEGLVWAGLVRWDRQELAGEVGLAWGEPAAAPAESALMSWLLREAESDAMVLAAHAHELGADGDVIAVVVRNDDAQRTVLLFVSSGRVPRHVREALEATHADLVHCFEIAPLVPAAPVPLAS